MVDIERLANSGALKTKVYIPGKSKQEVKCELGLSKVTKMASNESAIGVSVRAEEAYHEISGLLHIYPDPVSRDLREKLARLLSCSPGNITMGNGADGVIYNLGMAVIGEGDEAIIPETTFPLYETIVKIMRGKPVKTGMDGFRIDLDAMRRAITGKTKIIYLCNPNNPTGDAVEKKEIHDFIASVPEEVLVVIDEAYIDFIAPEEDPCSVTLFTSGRDNLFILRTFSKIFGLAGARIGYGICHEDLVSLIHRIKPPFNVSIIAEHVAAAALDDHQFMARTVDEIRREKELYYRILDQLGLEYVTSHTNFILVDTGLDAKQVFEEILQEGIIVRPCSGYGLPTCIRVTIGTHEENLLFLDTLKHLVSRHKKN